MFLVPLVAADTVLLIYHGEREMEVALRILPMHPYNDLLVGHSAGDEDPVSSGSAVPNYKSPGFVYVFLTVLSCCCCCLLIVSYIVVALMTSLIVYTCSVHQKFPAGQVLLPGVLRAATSVMSAMCLLEDVELQLKFEYFFLEKGHKHLVPVSVVGYCMF